MSTDKQIIPPGIIRFKADTNFTCDHWPEIDGTYEEWVTRHFANPEYTIHQIQVNGVLYTVGDVFRCRVVGDQQIIKSFYYKRENHFTVGWYVLNNNDNSYYIDNVIPPNPEPIPVEQPPVSEGIKSAEEILRKYGREVSGLFIPNPSKIIPAMEEYASQFKAPSPYQGKEAEQKVADIILEIKRHPTIVSEQKYNEWYVRILDAFKAPTPDVRAVAETAYYKGFNDCHYMNVHPELFPPKNIVQCCEEFLSKFHPESQFKAPSPEQGMTWTTEDMESAYEEGYSNGYYDNGKGAKDWLNQYKEQI